MCRYYNLIGEIFFRRIHQFTWCFLFLFSSSVRSGASIDGNYLVGLRQNNDNTIGLEDTTKQPIFLPGS
jgi:hypothetical protein